MPGLYIERGDEREDALVAVCIEKGRTRKISFHASDERKNNICSYLARAVQETLEPTGKLQE